MNFTPPKIRCSITLKILTFWISCSLLLPLSCKEKTNKDPEVFITQTGKKYHRIECTYLGKSRITTTLSKAIEKGYSPCSICNPDAIPGFPDPDGDAPQLSDTDGRPEEINATEVTNQCKGLTLKGARCKRTTSNASHYCYQHEFQRNSTDSVEMPGTKSLAKKKSFSDSLTDYPANSSNGSSRCKGITKKGVRCKRITRNASGYCYQHD